MYLTDVKRVRNLPSRNNSLMLNIVDDNEILSAQIHISKFFLWSLYHKKFVGFWKFIMGHLNTGYNKRARARFTVL